MSKVICVLNLLILNMCNFKGVFVKTAQVVEADVPMSNGCLHVIDDVLTPPK